MVAAGGADTDRSPVDLKGLVDTLLLPSPCCCVHFTIQLYFNMHSYKLIPSMLCYSHSCSKCDNHGGD